MISEIGGFMGLSQMASMRSHMGNPFEKVDANGDGSLDETEISTMADKVSEMTGESVGKNDILTKLDTDGDGLVNPEEFKAGRPKGPPPGMMGVGVQGGSMQSLLDLLNDSEDDEESSFQDSLDTNGDGIVDVQEAIEGMKSVLQAYQNQMTDAISEMGGNDSGLNLLA